MFAGNFAPNGSRFADGQALPIGQNQALFSLLEFTYGGNGQTTFALPDLRARAAVHAGSGPWLLGESTGVEQITLTESQMPAHAHPLPPPVNATGSTGGGQPITNVQPSLGLNYIIATEGIFPSPTGGAGHPFIGEVGLFAGNFPPRGWEFAEGQLLTIGQNTALFSILGNAYGGNGQTTFALPDLRGRTPVHAGTGPYQRGQQIGAVQTTLTTANLPAHDHSLPPSDDLTGSTGDNQPFTNVQPSLGLNYLIALGGVVPTAGGGGGGGGSTYVGEVVLFAGNFAPDGWAFPEGQQLVRLSNPDLYNVLGTRYGGGETMTRFNLPDLRGRTVVHAGTGPYFLGQQLGAAQTILTESQLPPHSHSVPLSGDIDFDDDVDAHDAALFSQFLGIDSDSVWTTGDFDGDEATTLIDLALLQSHLGQTPPSPQALGAAVPEPATWTLALIGLLATLTRRTVAARQGGPVDCRTCNQALYPLAPIAEFRKDVVCHWHGQ